TGPHGRQTNAPRLVARTQDSRRQGTNRAGKGFPHSYPRMPRSPTWIDKGQECAPGASRISQTKVRCRGIAGGKNDTAAPIGSCRPAAGRSWSLEGRSRPYPTTEEAKIE